MQVQAQALQSVDRRLGAEARQLSGLRGEPGPGELLPVVYPASGCSSGVGTWSLDEYHSRQTLRVSLSDFRIGLTGGSDLGAGISELMKGMTLSAPVWFLWSAGYFGSVAKWRERRAYPVPLWIRVHLMHGLLRSASYVPVAWCARPTGYYSAGAGTGNTAQSQDRGRSDRGTRMPANDPSRNHARTVRVRLYRSALCHRNRSIGPSDGRRHRE